MQKLIKGERDWHNKINNSFAEVEVDKTSILNTIGSDKLTTKAQNIKGAVNEVNEQLSQNEQQIENINNATPRSIYSKNIASMDTTSLFRVKNTFRKILDQDGLIISQTNFGVANYFEAVPSGTSEGGTNYFSRVLNLGSSSTIDSSVLNNCLKLSNANEAKTEEFFLTNQTIPCPHFFTILDIKECIGDIDNNPMIVLFKDTDNRVQIILHNNSNSIEIYMKIAGVVTSGVTTLTDAIKFSCRLGLLFANGELMAFFDNGNTGNWQYIRKETIGTFSGIEGFKYWKIGFGARMDTGTSMSLNSLTTMITPMLGYRDHTFITYEDGSPYIKDGKMFLTVTLGGGSMKSSGLGVIEYNPYSHETKLVSYLYIRLSNSTVHAGGMAQAIFDRNANIWRVLFSGFVARENGEYTYGNQFRGETKEDILNGIHFIRAGLLGLPKNNKMNCYDGCAIFDKSVNKWRIAYTAPAGTIHIAESEDFDTWTELSSASYGEGTKIVSFGGKYYVTVPKNREMYFLDYPTLTNPQKINVNTLTGHPHPHAHIIPVPGYETKYQFLTMDGARACGLDFSWGGTWIYECDVRRQGYDFDYTQTF